MSLWKETLRRFAYVGRRRRFDEELDAEVRFHIETRVEELQQSGLPRHAALAQAKREFGSPAFVFEETRAPWRFQWLEDICADLRYAARAFRRNPAFALTAIACLALGTGANTTVFSIATEVLFSRPSVRDRRTLVNLEPGGDSHSPMAHYRFLRDARIFADLAGENEEYETNWRNGDSTYRLFAVLVTDNFFNVTGTPVAIGRPIQTGETNTVVVTHRFWQQQLGGSDDVIGRRMVLDGRPYTVAGVLPGDHRTLMGLGVSPDLYMPVPGERSMVSLYARLPPDMSRQAAYARFMGLCRELDRVYPDGDHKWVEDARVNAISGMDHITGASQLNPVVAFFAMLIVVAGLVLLIACANVASLLLARASSRSHELAIRLSIGAGRGRIVRQLLAESLLLALCGTIAGLALNVGATALLSRIRLPLPIPIQFLIRPDWRLLCYSIAVTAGCVLASGLMPAIKGTRAGLGTALKNGEHQVGGSGWMLRHALVVGQIAISMVLLCAGFLFMRNLVQASSMSPGFDTAHTIWAYMRLAPDEEPRAKSPLVEMEKRRALIDAALDRLRALPGVQAAAIARVVPLNDANNMTTDIIPDAASRPIHLRFNNNYVGPGYFKTMAISILQGREFLPSDRKGAPHVAILNENMARRLFGNVNPIGHTIHFPNGAPIQVAGLAKNSKYFTLGEEHANAYYEPYAQWGGSIANLHFLVRTAGSPEALVPAINTTLGQLDPAAALETKPMRNALTFALLPSRVGAAILGSMGLLGLLLASIGLYGTLLYAVSRRIREIGLRMALGASPAAVLRMVLRRSFSLVAAGVGAGIALAVFAVRPLAMFLVPEVRTNDAANFAVVAAVLCAVALAATVAPALRALRVDPVAALRHE